MKKKMYSAMLCFGVAAGVAACGGGSNTGVPETAPASAEAGDRSSLGRDGGR